MFYTEIANFRDDLRSWLDDRPDLAPSGGVGTIEAEVAQLSRVRWALDEAGWTRYGWPASVGGRGGPVALRAVLAEELATRDLASPGLYSMLEVLAPTMIAYAPPGLAAEMVPRLLSGAEQWCQGFSEPGSGSDLASLSTRAARRDDGDWTITGQKVWTSLAQCADRCVLLTRTAPGHAGITAFFLDMASAGISVRPLRTMHGVDEFCEVFFDDVVVPAARMLGRPGDGWQLAQDLLPYERSTCFWARTAHLFGRLDAFSGLAAEPDDLALGEAFLALHTVRCRSHATQGRLADGERLGPETSVDKVLLAGAEQLLYDTVHYLAPGLLELADSPWRTGYLYSRAASIYGGTAEIQRNIIARRLLDLGRE